MKALHISTAPGRSMPPAASIAIPDNVLRKLVGSLPVYFYSELYRDGAHVITYHSPQSETVTGYQPMDYERDPLLWFKMIHDDDKRKVSRFLNDLRGRAHPLAAVGARTPNVPRNFQEWGKALEHRIIHREGVVRWVANHCNATFSENGTLERIDGMLMDITEQKLAEQELARQLAREEQLSRELAAQKRKSEEAMTRNEKFVSLVSHDLRSPLSSIIGFAHLLNNGQHTPTLDERKLLSERIESIGRHMLTMVDELLELTRLRSGRMALTRRFFDGAEFAGRIADNFQSIADSKGVRLACTIDKGTRLFADPHLFGELLSNLLSNAIKFCTRGCTVHISLERNRETATLIVSDDGPGVPKQYLPHLFDYDVATSSTGSAGEQGTGFGLPFCYEVMKAHGGSLAVESNGKGATFFAALPDKTPLILIADDDPLHCAGLARILAPLDVKVVFAPNGAEALAIMRRCEVHLVLATMVMPVLDGVAMLCKMRQDPALADVPFIFHTDGKSDRICGELIQNKTSDFIVWPLNPHDVIPRVRRYLG